MSIMIGSYLAWWNQMIQENRLFVVVILFTTVGAILGSTYTRLSYMDRMDISIIIYVVSTILLVSLWFYCKKYIGLKDEDKDKKNKSMYEEDI